MQAPGANIAVQRQDELQGEGGWRYLAYRHIERGRPWRPDALCSRVVNCKSIGRWSCVIHLTTAVMTNRQLHEFLASCWVHAKCDIARI